MLGDVDAVEAWLPAWLPAQRWFADKARPITGCRVVLSHLVDDVIAALVVRVTFSDGGDADYVVPLVARPLADATDSPLFLVWLGHLVSGTATWPDVVARRQLLTVEVDISDMTGKPLGVEQSNTSIRYGADWVVKLNRRLSYGPSPELELSPLLNGWAGPRCAPKTAASLSIRTDRGAASLAIQAEFVSNDGDGWAFILDALRREVRSGNAAFERASSIQELVAVAELTADVHAALAGDPWSAQLSPERIDREMAGSWEDGTTASLVSTLSLLDAARPRLSGRSRRLADLVSGGTPTIRQHASGFQALVGSRRTRIHGDYHLGQVLRTVGGRYLAIDFDGEPQRTLEERRSKYSPLRDVAGMMRSLAYAAGTVQAERDREVDDAWFPAWERAARSTFLETYVRRLEANTTNVLPRDPERIRQALGALELEKALYEVVYELNYRPDWAWIPLTQLVRMG